MGLTQAGTDGIKDDAISLAKMAAGTDGQIITYDASGNPVAVGPGTDGQVLTSTGAGSPPAFEDASSGGATLSGSTDNTVVTVTGANAIQGESTLTYDGTTLFIANTTPTLKFQDTDTSGAAKCNIDGAGGDLDLRADDDEDKGGSKVRVYVDNVELARFSTSTETEFKSNVRLKSGAASYLRWFDVSTNTLDFYTNSTNLIIQDVPNTDNCIKFEAVGDIRIDGSYHTGGADYAEYFESTDGSAIPVGTTVVLENGKVRAATDSETPIGVIRPKTSGTSIVGATAELKWSGKYLTDDYDGALTDNAIFCTWEENEEHKQCWKDRPPTGVTIPSDAVEETRPRPRLNPDYDPSKTYVPRSERAEWNCVGLLGQTPITKGQPVASSWIKMKDKSSTVELWFVK